MARWVVLALMAVQVVALALAVTAEGWLEFARYAFMALFLSRVFRVDGEEVEELADEYAPLLLAAGLAGAAVSVAAYAYTVYAGDPLSLAKAALVAWMLAPRVTLRARG